MREESWARIRQVTPGMRWMLLIASGLVFIIGIPLYLFSGQTASYFAWTIDLPLTAAFLGGAYWASCALEFMAAREAQWARARIAVPAVLIFTALTLVVTLIHLDRFHLSDQLALNTRFVTWAWLIVYAVVPPILAILLLLQSRAPGADPLLRQPIALPIRATVGGLGVLLVVLGIGLLLAPLSVGGLWPWALTALTGRAIGAWLVGLGVAAAHAARERDWIRVRAAAAGFVLLGALELLALVRYSAAVRWGDPRLWVYLLCLLGLAAFGLYGLATTGWLADARARAAIERSASR